MIIIVQQIQFQIQPKQTHNNVYKLNIVEIQWTCYTTRQLHRVRIKTASLNMSN